MEANQRHRGVIKREHVRVDGNGARARPLATQAEGEAACTAHPGGVVPRVRVVALDEHTQAFEFTCTCGEVSLIEIQYEKNP